ncbi:MAG: hypothetical protein KDD11_09260, partial [Acidobacteria bacterium]|nr:hypothetical protein [Acidobacteriota bacterium]
MCEVTQRDRASAALPAGEAKAGAIDPDTSVNGTLQDQVCRVQAGPIPGSCHQLLLAGIGDQVAQTSD